MNEQMNEEDEDVASENESIKVLTLNILIIYKSSLYHFFPIDACNTKSVHTTTVHHIIILLDCKTVTLTAKTKSNPNQTHPLHYSPYLKYTHKPFAFLPM